jgi:Carboxypeptidase regulatory-like domain
MFFKRHSTAAKWAALIAIALLTCIVGSAQTTGLGTISGTVADTSGGVIPGAKVTLTNVATGVVRGAVTNDIGYYEVNALMPGSYRISFVHTSFRETVREGVTVQANGHASVPAQLAPGVVTETVTVREEINLLNTESGRQGEALSTKQVESLPTSGVNPIWLVSLAPGVTPGWGQSA